MNTTTGQWLPARAASEACRSALHSLKVRVLCREHLNIVFIGHVDAGKSTTGGQILYLTVRPSARHTLTVAHLCRCQGSHLPCMSYLEEELSQVW